MPVKVSKEVYEKLVGKSIDIKAIKYRNKKIEYDGYTFDSIKEKSWYIKFKLMQQAGDITNLELQKEYELMPKFECKGKKYKKMSYYADFVYKQDGKIHVVDVKSEATKKDKVYLIKKKLLVYEYGIEIEEV